MDLGNGYEIVFEGDPSFIDEEEKLYSSADNDGNGCRIIIRKTEVTTG